MSRTTHQTFKTRTIHRGEITPAPYNPRAISPYSRSLLKDKIEDVGLVEPLVWNEMTGNLVSGHQRLSILDEMEGGTDYDLDVAVVALEPAREKELVVFMNNQNAQGIFDEDLLASLLADSAVTLEGMGYTDTTLQMDFPDLVIAGAADQALEAAGSEQGDPLVEQQEQASSGIATDIDAIKAARKAGKEAAQDSPEFETEYFLVVAFRSEKDRNKFLKANGFMTGVTHISGDELEPLVKQTWRTPGDEGEAEAGTPRVVTPADAGEADPD
jgi:hypothetical protein